MKEPILELKDLDKVYPNGVHAVRGVSYRLDEGGCYAFLGPNGAGKSTTISMVCGLCIPTSGSIHFFDTDIRKDPASYRSSIGVVSQHANLELDLTAAQNLRIHANLYDLPGREYPERAERLLKVAGLQDKKDEVVRSLSGGMKRKLQIIRALLHDPGLLILDEPTVGLDPASRRAIWDILLSLKRAGKTILFSTHYMEEAHAYADSISIIHQGSIIKRGTADSLIDDLGSWCRLEYEGMAKRVSFFPTHKEALEGTGSPVDELIVRKTTLEDVFIDLTGKELEK